MTNEGMCRVITNYCDRSSCENCKIYSVCASFSGCFELRPDKAEEAYKILTTGNEVNTNSSNIYHPGHYNREGAMECIDEMLLIFGVEATKNFCLLNAWKYRYRAADKNGEEDLKKSDWYLRKYKELYNGTENI